MEAPDLNNLSLDRTGADKACKKQELLKDFVFETQGAGGEIRGKAVYQVQNGQIVDFGKPFDFQANLNSAWADAKRALVSSGEDVDSLLRDAGAVVSAWKDRTGEPEYPETEPEDEV